MNQKPISDLRSRMLEDMAVRRLGEKTQHDYIKHVETFAVFLGRSPDTATAEDLRRFQVHETAQGSKPPKMNTQVSALRFFLDTLGRLDLAHQLARVDYPRKLPRVLSPAMWPVYWRLRLDRASIQGRVECGLRRRTALRRGCRSARERYRQQTDADPR